MKKTARLKIRFFWNLAWTTVLFIFSIFNLLFTGMEIVEYFKINGFEISAGPRPIDDLDIMVLYLKFTFFFVMYALSIAKSWIGKYLIKKSWKDID